MASRTKLCVGVICAAMAALLPCARPQNPVGTPVVQPVPTDSLHQQIVQLLSECDSDINVHGEFQRAADCSRHARELSRKVGDKINEASALVYLGAALGYQGRLDESYEVAQETLVVARDSGDKKVLEQALNNLASVAGGLGRYEESVATFYACLSLAREINDPVMEYISLLNIGEAYTRSGEPNHAEDPLKKALQLAGELDHGDANSKARAKKGAEMALLNLGGMEMAREHYASALKYFEQVHGSQPATPLWAISALQGMGNANQMLGRPQEAIPLFEQAIAMAEKSSGAAQIAAITSDLGISQEAIGRLGAALASQTGALGIVHDGGGDRDLEWQIESRMGHVLRAMGRDDDALDQYQKSIAGIERLRSVALSTEEGRAGVLAKSHNTYGETADLLVDMHRDDEAFAIAERGRARAFLETLALARGGLPDDLTPQQTEKEKSLLEQVSAAQKAIWKEGLAAKDEPQHRTELRRAEENLDAFRLEVRQANPRYASVRYPEPVDVTRIQNELLDGKTVLVEFLLGSKRSLVWVISRASVTVHSLPPRKQIDAAVAEYRRLLRDKTSFLTLHSSLESITLHGTALYRTLLAPISQAIPANASLIIVPDGALNYLPFETLVIGSKRDADGDTWPIYELQSHSITYAPSASALLAVRATNSEASQWDKTLLAFGDPVVQFHKPAGMDEVRSVAGASAQWPVFARTAYEAYTERGFSITRLPFTREEVLGIARLFPENQRQLYLGTSATAASMKSENLNHYRYIHFATHALIDETAPDRSGIVLSPDSRLQEIGVLQSVDIMRLRLNADLVTISACSTGLGEMVNGEGVLGLTRAFFYAGARNVTVSLWNVNDSATSALMKEFYTRLNEGATKSDALRGAKLRLLNGPNLTWRNPYFWGAFVLTGYGK